MKERLFFYRINRFSANLPVCRGIQSPPNIFPHTADPVLPLTDLAPVVTERTLHIGIFHLCILARFVHGGSGSQVMDFGYFLSSFPVMGSSSSTSSTNDPRYLQVLQRYT
jgi:hypothetical protein